MKSPRSAVEEDITSFLIPLRVVTSSLNVVNKAKMQTTRPFISSNKQPTDKPGGLLIV